MPETASRVALRNAQPEDAEAILRLKQSAFERYLPLTPYQSPASAEVLRSLIETSSVRLAVQGEEIVGYTMASATPGGHHLGYIVSRAPGVGGVLLDDFERLGGRLSLDVFESNAAPVAWYGRRGYREVGAGWSFALDLASVEPERTVEVASDALQGALAEEKRRGVSRFDATIDGRPVALGLIAGDTVRVLNAGDLPLSVVAAAVAAWAPDRKSLIVCGSSTKPEGMPLTLLERSLRLEKSI